MGKECLEGSRGGLSRGKIKGIARKRMILEGSEI